MKKRLISALCALALLALPLSARAQEMVKATPAAEVTPSPTATLAPETHAVATSPLETELPFELEAASVLLMEPESGQVIFEKNADDQRPVASVTKVMSILLALEAVEQGRAQMDDQVIISKQAAGMGGSQVLLDVGETQSYGVLLKSMIVGSANDAAVAIAEHLYGSEQLFVERMNERARALGMRGTHFVNCTGLPAEGHYTTARDVALMSVEVLRHPLYFDYSTIWLDEVDHGDGRKTSLTNTNRLIRLYEGCDGVKTGSTNEAGYCMSATAKRGDMRLIAVVLGAETGKTRFAIAGKMMDHGFANYRRYPVAQSGAKVRGEIPVSGGNRGSVPLKLDGNLTLLVKRGEEQRIELTPELPELLHAPVAMGQQVGVVNVVLEGRQIAKIPVVAAAEVGRHGFWDGFDRVIQRWFYR